MFVQNYQKLLYHSEAFEIIDWPNFRDYNLWKLINFKNQYDFKKSTSKKFSIKKISLSNQWNHKHCWINFWQQKISQFKRFRKACFSTVFIFFNRNTSKSSYSCQIFSNSNSVKPSLSKRLSVFAGLKHWNSLIFTCQLNKLANEEDSCTLSGKTKHN